jgi:hypothetical protein
MDKVTSCRGDWSSDDRMCGICAASLEEHGQDAQEAALNERDVRVQEALRFTIKSARQNARELRQQAAEVERFASEIEGHALAGRWYALEGILDSGDIESLCNVEPSDRKEFLGGVS